MVQKPGRHCLLYRTARHRPVAGRQRPTGEKGWGNSGPVTRASLHSSPATIHMHAHEHAYIVHTDRDEGHTCFTKIFGEEKCLKFAVEGD